MQQGIRLEIQAAKRKLKTGPHNPIIRMQAGGQPRTGHVLQASKTMFIPTGMAMCNDRTIMVVGIAGQTDNGSSNNLETITHSRIPSR